MSIRQGDNIIAGKVQVDETPTLGSTRPVSSDGVYRTCANRDSDNFTNAGKTYLSGLGMPNILRYESLTVLATGSEYTAPANGWFFASGTCRSGASVGVVRLTNNTNPDMLVDSSSWCSGATGRTVSVFLPMKAGDTAEFIYGSYTNTDLKMIFVYADGDKSNE